MVTVARPAGAAGWGPGGGMALGWVVALALAFASCTGKAEDTTTTSTTPPSTTTTTLPSVRTGVGVGDGVITLAALLPLSGTLEPLGRSALEGHEASGGWAAA